MARLFHFNLCVRLLLEWFIFMHHTLDSSVLSPNTFTGMFLSQSRVNDTIFFIKYAAGLLLIRNVT